MNGNQMESIKGKGIGVSAVVPALNEENNILHTVSNILKAFEEFAIDGEIIVVNDGSTDKTGELVSDVMKRDARVRMLTHDAPRGIGGSFWDGVDNAHGEIIVMIPGDNETDPWEIFRYYRLLDSVDIVIPFVFNKEVRSLFRRALSSVYRTIVNATFFVNFNYTNGTILYRKSILKELEYRSTGFFFQTDILIRTVKRGYLFAEVPYRLGYRKDGLSKAVSFPSLMQVVKGYLLLVRDNYFKKGFKGNKNYAGDSMTAARR